MEARLLNTIWGLFLVYLLQAESTTVDLVPEKISGFWKEVAVASDQNLVLKTQRRIEGLFLIFSGRDITVKAVYNKNVWVVAGWLPEGNRKICVLETDYEHYTILKLSLLWQGRNFHVLKYFTQSLETEDEPSFWRFWAMTEDQGHYMLTQHRRCAELLKEKFPKKTDSYSYRWAYNPLKTPGAGFFHPFLPTNPRTRKTNMTPPESRDSTPTGSEKPNTEHEDEMDLKNYLGKMIEIFKEETRKSLKEIEEKANKKLHKMEEKTNQKIQEINKSLKESKETQEKTSRQVKDVLETVQSMKAEIDTIKKTQNESMVEMERLDKRSGTKDVNITNRIQEMEKRTSAIEDSLEDIHSSTKENLKFNKSLTQNIQEIWDTMKRPNLRIIGIEEGEETLLKGFWYEIAFSGIREDIAYSDDEKMGAMRVEMEKNLLALTVTYFQASCCALMATRRCDSENCLDK
ncbi:epididymal-specific lipocalin-8-like protein [Cricetulus griseus]|nr:epididymal-specific lipocalin-8-like protein [Cricetulus griseus]